MEAIDEDFSDHQLLCKVSYTTSFDGFISHLYQGNSKTTQTKQQAINGS